MYRMDSAFSRDCRQASSGRLAKCHCLFHMRAVTTHSPLVVHTIETLLDLLIFISFFFSPFFTPRLYTSHYLLDVLTRLLPRIASIIEATFPDECLMKIELENFHVHEHDTVVVVEVYVTSYHKQAVSPPLIHVDDRGNERGGGGGAEIRERGRVENK